MDTVANVLTAFGSMITSVISWLGDLLAFITGNPVILVPMLMFFVVGGIVGILMRIMRG